MISLLKTRGFMPLVSVVYLNAFIDLGHKIIIQNTIFKIYDGSFQIVLTAIINALVLLPFVLFFIPAGQASDRHAKTQILRLASVAALVLTGLIGLCYWQGWFWPAFALTFVLAVQSAYYGPAKYGLLKELVENDMLSRANGITQALATIGILSGILCFSILFEWRFPLVTVLDKNHLVQAMAPLSWGLIAIGAIECLLAWQLPIFAPQPAAKLEHRHELQTLVRSPILWPAIIGLSVFWSVGQMLLATYPAFAKAEIGITNTVVIQGLLATIGLGIMLGSVIGGRLSRGHIEMALIPAAGIGICLTAFLLPMVTHIIPASLMFFAIGVVGGFMVVPLNACVQYCSDADKLGITIANSNLIQNIAMLTCLFITVCSAFFDVSAKSLLFFVAVVAIAGIGLVLYKLPYTLLRLRNPVGKRLIVEGFNIVSGHGKVAFIIDDISEKNLQLLQMAYPRKIGQAEDALAECRVTTDENLEGYQKYQVTIRETEKACTLQFSPAA